MEKILLDDNKRKVDPGDQKSPKIGLRARVIPNAHRAGGSFNFQYLPGNAALGMSAVHKGG